MTKKATRKRRFWQGKLPAAKWSEKQRKALYEFVRHELTTEDEKLAELLLAEGYEEIPLDLPIQCMYSPDAMAQYHARKAIERQQAEAMGVPLPTVPGD